MKKIKKIGIFTSGGDCSGLNAVIAAVVKRCTEKDIEVFGIHNGTEGLYYPNLSYQKLENKDFQTQFSCIRTGGTILGTVNKGDPTSRKMPDGTSQDVTESFRRGVKELGLDSLIVIGGDGSAMITSKLVKDTDINVIAIPKTIDNDTPITDYSIGFDTARNICMDSLDKLQTTASSHHRVMIMEVMGRDAGHLALHSAIAGGANVCLIPEIPYKFENIVKKLKEVKKSGVTYSLVVVAEGCKTEENEHVKKNGSNCYGGFANYIASKLEQEKEDFLCRTTILGHIQRGGSPSAYDRIMASMFGVYAVDILIEGKNNRIVILKDNKVSDVDLFEAVKVGNTPVDKFGDIAKTAKALGMYIGE